MTQWFADNVLHLPELASKNGKAIDALMVYIHVLMLALFVGWIIYFFYALYRFRSRAMPRPIITVSAIMRPVTLSSPSLPLRRCS